MVLKLERERDREKETVPQTLPALFNYLAAEALFFFFYVK